MDNYKVFCRKRFFGMLQLARGMRTASRGNRQVVLAAYRLGFTEAWGLDA